jgi:hypothetical protein
MKAIEIRSRFERMVERLFGLYDHEAMSTQNADLVPIEKNYGIPVVAELDSSEPPLLFRKPTSTQVRAFAPILSAELNLYTPEIIRRSKVERIVLASELVDHGNEISGLAMLGFFIVDSLFIDLNDARDDFWGRKTIHHELYHAIDFNDTWYHYMDREWRQLQGKDYTYVRRIDFHGVAPTDKRGFMSNYSATALAEDKAELFEHMMTEYHRVQERCKRDPVIARKVEKMKELLDDFCSDFNEAFWERINERSQLLARGLHDAKGHLLQPAPATVSVVSHGRYLVWQVLIDDKVLCKRLYFYTYNKLRNALQRMHASAIPDKEEIKKGPVSVTIAQLES